MRYRGEMRYNPENMKLELWDNLSGEFIVSSDENGIIDYFPEARMHRLADGWETEHFAVYRLSQRQRMFSHP